MTFGVSYFGVRDPRHARADLDEIAGAGFEAVTHTFSEHDLRYHVEDVRRLVEETKRRGLEAALDPWGVGGLFGGEAYSELALTDLECRQVDASGRSLPAACPNAPATRDLLLRWTGTAVDLGADVLFWDEPHFDLGAFRDSSPISGCRCGSCRRAWAKRVGGDFPAEDDSRLPDFRADSLRRLLAAATAAAPGVRHSLCLLPRGEFRSAGTDDWSVFTDLGVFSRLGTDPYWMERPVEPSEFVREHARSLRERCDATGLEMEIWIQGVRLATGKEHHIVEAVDAALDEGADRIAFWSFRGTERMASLTCEDPEAAWKAMKSAVARGRAR